MELSPIDRIEAFCREKGIGSLSELARLIGASTSTFSIIKKRGRPPGTQVMQMLTDKYPDLNSNWVLYGKGSMYLNDQRLTPVTQPPAQQGTSTMVAVPNVEDMTPEQQATFFRLRSERAERKVMLLERQLADYEEALDQQQAVQLVSQAGGRSGFNDASADAADEDYTPPQMKAETNLEYVERAAEAERMQIRRWGNQGR